MSGGVEWLVDADGCDAGILRDEGALRAVCARVVTELGLRVVGEPVWHAFPGPGGLTGMYLLAESHLTCHTFPETGRASFNVYCCRPRPVWDWDGGLRGSLGADRVAVRRVERAGIPATEPARP